MRVWSRRGANLATPLTALGRRAEAATNAWVLLQVEKCGWTARAVMGSMVRMYSVLGEVSVCGGAACTCTYSGVTADPARVRYACPEIRT